MTADRARRARAGTDAEAVVEIGWPILRLRA
jgi:hypothetical protein